MPPCRISRSPSCSPPAPGGPRAAPPHGALAPARLGGHEHQPLEASGLRDLRRHGPLATRTRPAQLSVSRGTTRIADRRPHHLPLRLVSCGLRRATGSARPPGRTPRRRSPRAAALASAKAQAARHLSAPARRAGMVRMLFWRNARALVDRCHKQGPVAKESGPPSWGEQGGGPDTDPWVRGILEEARRQRTLPC